MSPYLGFIAHATEGNALERPLEGFRDGLGDGGLTAAWGTDESGRGI